MKEHHIQVSLNGIFLFRTQWDDNLERVQMAAVTITTSMPLAQVSVYTRAKVMGVCSVDDFLRIKE